MGNVIRTSQKTVTGHADLTVDLENRSDIKNHYDPLELVTFIAAPSVPPLPPTAENR